MDNLTSKVLKAIAREHGIKGWASMTKAKLVEALQPIEIIVDNLRVNELISLAKVRGIEGYKTMRRTKIIEAMSALIPEVEMPIPGVTRPRGKLSFKSLKRLASKASDTVMTEVNKFEDWVLSKVPELVKNNSFLF